MTGTATPSQPPARDAPEVRGIQDVPDVPAAGRVPAGYPGASLAEVRWAQFFRYGPYLVLGLATLLAVVSADDIMSRTEVYAAGVLLVLVLALQLWWSFASTAYEDRVNATVLTIPPRGQAGTAGQVYYALRTLLAFALTWANPFFAIYAVIGYFDASHLLPVRRLRLGLLATTVIMAGSQSGGLPPQSRSQWIAFLALFVLNAFFCLVFVHIGGHEEDALRQKARAYRELERTNARLTQALAENAHLQAQLLVQAREAGVADERRRLAAEIHDTIAQGLAGIIAQLQVVTVTRDEETAREHLARAADLARSSLREARRSVHNLSPVALEHDTLPQALEKTVAEWSKSSGVAARFTVTGTEEPLHAEVEATLLRIAQEALANTARHAGASRAGVTLSYLGDEVIVDVRDDGRGFDPLAVPARSGSGGFGLEGMRSRAERIAGTAQVESEPGQGTAVSARVPLVRHG
ncbi:sensor histidine kinase [Streptomyces sp. NPDC047315]|uniref:sensor histidine kinase n=1 Tax=Streptomyces sp. NPDC047315 TaxID=3155142 RepID=UPI0034118500